MRRALASGMGGLVSPLRKGQRAANSSQISEPGRNKVAIDLFDDLRVP